MKIEPFVPEHYAEAMRLWKSCEGIGLSDADSEENIAFFLGRNPGYSFIALERGKLVGTILCGHDGRRGFIYHLAVSPEFRLQGIGERLVKKALEKLGETGIRKSHIFVLSDNFGGRQFWRRLGFVEREDISVFSRSLP